MWVRRHASTLWVGIHMRLDRKNTKRTEIRLCLDPLFWECILENAFLLECILENAFFIMHFTENSAFGKILKLFIKNDYAKKNCVCLVF
jgi:hypothetical protein